MFVPSGISLAANLKIMETQGVQLVIVIIASTIILLVVVAYTTRFFSWAVHKITSNQTSIVDHKKVGGVK